MAMAEQGHAPYRETIRHYERLAASYDRRWRWYNRRALTAALEGLRLSGAERLLDAGCGTGEFERVALARFPHLRIVGLDITPATLAIARNKLAHAPQVSFQVAQVEMLPYAAGAFDAVVSASMLHYVRQPQRFFEECARVLRPGWQCVVVDWCGDFWRSRILGRWCRLMSRAYAAIHRLDELKGMLVACGFSVTRADRFTAPPCYGMMRLIAHKAVSTSI